MSALDQGSSLLNALAGLGLASYYFSWVRKSSPGNERMVFLMTEIQKGAKAFLRKEYQWVALFAVAMAILLAIVVGVMLGFLIGSSRIAYAAIYPLMTAFNALPHWAEIGTAAKHQLGTLAQQGHAFGHV